jgi:phosphatidylglycerophosphatase GEP4
MGPAQCRCKTEELVMVGDRYMTDVVFGNRLGMLTIRPAPLTWDGEPSTVKMVRMYS